MCFMTVGVDSHVASDVNRHIPMITAESSVSLVSAMDISTYSEGITASAGVRCSTEAIKPPAGAAGYHFALPFAAFPCSESISSSLSPLLSALSELNPLDRTLRVHHLASWRLVIGESPSAPSHF